MVKFTINPEVTSLVRFAWLNNIPLIEDRECWHCGRVTQHKVVGVDDCHFEGIDYVCQECGMTESCDIASCKSGTSEVEMRECVNCKDSRPHVRDVELDEVVWICAACGKKHISKETLESLESDAELTDEEWGSDASKIRDEAIAALKYFKENGYFSK